MAEKGQTEANYNLRNTNEIDHKVGERKKREEVRLATSVSLKISGTP